jgi:hypothetical protein
MRDHNYARCERHDCHECAQIVTQAEARAEGRWADSRMEPYDIDGYGGYIWWEPRS